MNASELIELTTYAFRPQTIPYDRHCCLIEHRL